MRSQQVLVPVESFFLFLGKVTKDNQPNTEPEESISFNLCAHRVSGGPMQTDNAHANQGACRSKH